MSLKRTALALVIAAAIAVPATGISTAEVHDATQAHTVSTLADGGTTPPPATPDDTNWG